ncbi:MAG: hypothetical protein HWE10_15530 [Gammaproteobacteria bacterium]|nr:hypothetical protein [Gammaproteobacteria bacterium]
MALLSFKPYFKKATWLLSALAAATVSSTAWSANLSDTQVERLTRDMKIMRTILDTSLAAQTNSRPRVESVYLARQGMLFTIETRGGFHFDFEHLSKPVVVPIAPKPPKAPVVTEIYFSEEKIEQIEEYAMQAAESAMEMAEVSLEFMSDVDWSSYSSAERSEQMAEQTQLRREKRELEREARKLERQVREIERMLRDSQFEQELENSESNEKLSEKLKAKLSGYTESLSEVAEKLQVNATKLQERAKKVKEEQEKKQKQRLLETEILISETVCDFGSGLRSLPDNEHISFQIEGRVNKLYVFDKENITACGQGDITAKKLLESSTKYSM